MKKILFADDDPEIREVVRILLARDSYEVVEAVNGIEAVEKADHTIDLIILDVMMPGCSGVEACGEIRKKSSAPILFLTAKSRDRDKEEGFAAGGDGYLGETVFRVGVKGWLFYTIDAGGGPICVYLGGGRVVNKKKTRRRK